ncbi:hypothetical protein OKA05_06835 [Luteolibacter arcticus]|uniref:Antitoxin n=1 Tax=Luteolibacter arcticus TaxID=1581411 RepID=A0ABT3GF74_9BACT|nr:hypothetical protein [Luteolibacter arcticus]MCW1922262.1 hypothetical protein [Luteolibacter arcticus]
MKTSIDLPESLHCKATALANQQGVTLDEVVVAVLEKGLDPNAGTPKRRAGEPHFDIDDLGLPRLRCVPGDPTVVTEALLNQLREQERI